MSFSQNDLVVGPGARLSRGRRLLFALLLAMLGAFGPLSIDTYLPSLPQIAGDLSISTAATQGTITAFLLGMALGLTNYLIDAGIPDAAIEAVQGVIPDRNLFLLALFFAPLAGSVPAFATAPALLFVAVLMASGLAEINWDDVTEAAPVVVTALAMPLTYSIANGIAFGFISWTAVKLISGRHRDLNPALVILSILFVIKLGWFNA